MTTSAHLVTDAQAIITNGPSVTTNANAIAPSGPIQDYVGNTKQLLLKLQEASQLATLIINDTAASDDGTNLALLQGITGTLV